MDKEPGVHDRHSPEDFLHLIQRQARGKLKVYLGSSAGVGKTYSMLVEGNRLRKLGGREKFQRRLNQFTARFCGFFLQRGGNIAFGEFPTRHIILPDDGAVAHQIDHARLRFRAAHEGAAALRRAGVVAAALAEGALLEILDQVEAGHAAGVAIDLLVDDQPGVGER